MGSKQGTYVNNNKTQILPGFPHRNFTLFSARCHLSHIIPSIQYLKNWNGYEF
jgi:hypothetical protein